MHEENGALVEGNHEDMRITIEQGNFMRQNGQHVIVFPGLRAVLLPSNFAQERAENGTLSVTTEIGQHKIANNSDSPHFGHCYLLFVFFYFSLLEFSQPMIFCPLHVHALHLALLLIQLPTLL